MKKPAALRSLLAVILVILAMTGISISQAAVTPGTIGYDPKHITLLGTFKPSGYKKQMLCIDARKTNPTKVTKAVRTRSPFPAYAAHVYQQTKDRDTAAGYALAVGRKNNTNKTALEAAFAALPSATRTKVANHARRITQEANDYQGPYTLPLAFKGDEATANATGRLVAIGVKSAAGKWVPNISGTVQLTNGTFADGSTQKTIKTGKAAQELIYRALGNSTVTANLSITNLPPTDVLIHQPQASGYQRVMVDAGPSKATATAAISATTTWNPIITTKLVKKVVVAGQPIVDIAWVSGGRPNTGFSGTFSFYESTTLPVESSEIPAGAKPFATVPYSGKFNDSGVASGIKATANAPANSGYFTVVATITANPDQGINGYTAKWGEADETGVTLNIAPTTKVASDSINIGDPNSDTWVINGALAEVDGTPVDYFITPKLHGPIPKVDGVCPVGADVWSDSPVHHQFPKSQITWGTEAKPGTIRGTLVDGKLTVQLGEYAPTQGDGCYSYGGTVTVSMAGTELVSVPHELGDPKQGFFVAGPAPVETPSPTPSPEPSPDPEPEPSPPEETPEPEPSPDPEPEPSPDPEPEPSPDPGESPNSIPPSNNHSPNPATRNESAVPINAGERSTALPTIGTGMMAALALGATWRRTRTIGKRFER